MQQSKLFVVKLHDWKRVLHGENSVIGRCPGRTLDQLPLFGFVRDIAIYKKFKVL